MLLQSLKICRKNKSQSYSQLNGVFNNNALKKHESITSSTRVSGAINL